MYGNSSSNVNDFRRKWNRDEYEQKAQERKRKDNPSAADDNDGDSISNKDDPAEPPKKRENLKARDHKVDLESKLGKTVVISKATPSNQAGGFYCEICDCVVKDSINYLDHINGKKHQRNLGMNMRIKRSTLDDVKARFELKLKEKEQQKKEYDIGERMQELKEEEEKLKEYRKEKRKEKKQKKKHHSDDEDQDDDQMASMMGFASFGSGKKK